MAAAAIGTEGFRTGMVAITATAGDLLNVNPHVHAIAPRGGWDSDGEWTPVPYVDRDTAERLFRAKVLSMLTGEGLLSEERRRVLMSWRHNSGFSVDDSVRFEPENKGSLEKVARYLLRPPLSLARMTLVIRSLCRCHNLGRTGKVYARAGTDLPRATEAQAPSAVEVSVCPSSLLKLLPRPSSLSPMPQLMVGLSGREKANHYP